MATLKAFWRDTRGVTSIEYAVIAGLLSILIVTGATAIGTTLKQKISPIATVLS